jgi:cytochrome b
MNPTTSVRVWDLPTRLFHWSLVILVTLAWFTGEGEGIAGEIHRYSGEAIAGLLIFRFAWGFAGGEHARFSSFIYPKGAIAAHIKELSSFHVERTLGHNPLGAVASLALMVTVALIVVTGLFSAGEESGSGPFAGLLPGDIGEIHEVLFRILQGLVVLHLAGVAVTSLAGRENLVRAMITGRKTRAQGGAFRDATNAARPALLASLAVSVLSAAALMALPHKAGAGEHGENQSGYADEDDD